MKTRSGFSLVEVVLAFAICSFCIIALLGLFSAGLKGSQESIEDIQASNIATLLLSQRRASPTNTGSFPPLLLPVLNVPANNSNAPVYLTGAGAPAQAGDAAWRLTYAIQTNSWGVSQVALSLTAPASVPAARARTRYDVLTYVRLP